MEGSEKGVWKNLRGRGGECLLRGKGVIQSATRFTMCKRGLVGGFGQETFENGGNVLDSCHRDTILITSLLRRQMVDVIHFPPTGGEISK